MKDQEKINQALEEKSEEEFIGLQEDMGDVRVDAENIIREIEGKRKKPITSKDKEKEGKRPDKNELNMRYREIMQLQNRGFSYVEIIEYGKKRWEVAGRTVERYIEKTKSIDKIPARDIKHQRQDAIGRALYIYKQAVNSKNPAIALQALKEINKLSGLYTEQVILDNTEEEEAVKTLIQGIADNQLTKDDISKGVIKVKKDGKTDKERNSELIPKDI